MSHANSIATIPAMLTQIRQVATDFKQRNIASPSHIQSKLDIVAKTRTSLFPWRGQFSPQFIEHIFEEFAPTSGIVLDPFCGSGTVLAEAAREGLGAYGFDINPAAFLFASMHQLCNLSGVERHALIGRVSELLSRSYQGSLFCEVPCDPVTSILSLRGPDLLVGSVALMLAMGDSRSLDVKKLSRSLAVVNETLQSMPFSKETIKAMPLDSRAVPLGAHTVDLVVTSPPYINVFNYHQNYRPAMELLGWSPLKVAVAEIGANRKHRQNRFLTVIQYAIDMGLVLREMHRVMKTSGHLVLVVGRCSSVRRVTFPNGMMLALVAQQLSDFDLSDWRERQFINRFGEQIYEDILILKPNARCQSNDPLATGRAVGSWALEQGYGQADREVQKDIDAALRQVADVMPSPITRVAVPDQFKSIAENVHRSTE